MVDSIKIILLASTSMTLILWFVSHIENTLVSITKVYEVADIIIGIAFVVVTGLMGYYIYKQVEHQLMNTLTNIEHTDILEKDLRTRFMLDSFKIVEETRTELTKYSKLINDIIHSKQDKKRIGEAYKTDCRRILNTIEILGLKRVRIDVDIEIIHELLYPTIKPLYDNPFIQKMIISAIKINSTRYKYLIIMMNDLDRVQARYK